MQKVSEFLQYVSASLGMALAISCYAIIGSLFQFESGLWLVGGILVACLCCLIVAGATAELAMRFPSAPGLRTYFKQAFGNQHSLFLILVYMSIVVFIASVESYAFGEILQVLDIELSRVLTGILLIIVIAAVNLMGFEMTLKVQLWSVILLVLSMVGISIYGIMTEPAMNPATAHELIQPLASQISESNNDTMVAMATIIATALFLFVGFEWVTPMGKSAQAYQRMIPLSMMVGIAVLGLLYGLFAYASGNQLNEQQLQASVAPQLLLGETLFGIKGTYVLAAISFLAMFTSFNVGMLGASRLVYGIAREGELPAWFTRISFKTLAPYGAILFLSALCMIGTVITNLYAIHFELANAAVIITCLVYTAIIAAALKLRRDQGKLSTRFALHGALLIPMALVFLVLGLVLFIENLNSATPYILLGAVVLAALYAYRIPLKAQALTPFSRLTTTK